MPIRSTILRIPGRFRPSTCAAPRSIARGWRRSGCLANRLMLVGPRRRGEGLGRSRHTEAVRAPRLDCQASDAGSRSLAVEIQQQSDRQFQDTHVRKELCLMKTYRRSTLFISTTTLLDDQIGSILPDQPPAILDRDSDLP